MKIINKIDPSVGPNIEKAFIDAEFWGNQDEPIYIPGIGNVVSRSRKPPLKNPVKTPPNSQASPDEDEEERHFF